jgi:DNA replication initiation complex subunit (GINS family)
MRDYEKARRLSRDIINLRLKKIVSLASSPAQTNQILGSLTREERVVYERLYGIISVWRAKILKIKGGGES